MLLANTSPSKTISGKRGAAGFHRRRADVTQRQAFGEWLASAAKARASAAADIQHFTLVCGVSVDSSSWLPTSSPSRLNTPWQRFTSARRYCTHSAHQISKTKTAAKFPDDHGKAATSLSTLFQRRIVRQHRLERATHAAAVFLTDENIDARRHQRQKYSSTELRWVYFFGRR